MRRKITVYGLRFSKTTFWNRINTGFLDPAVATVLTACGIETFSNLPLEITSIKLQQYLPLAVLKPAKALLQVTKFMLQQYLPLAVLKRVLATLSANTSSLQQYLPLAVLKHICYMFKRSISCGCNSTYRLRYWNTGVTTLHRFRFYKRCNSTYRLRYWNKHVSISFIKCCSSLQQYLPLAVLKLKRTIV